MVIPVYNTMPYLADLLDSLAAQDLDPALFEIVAVDDGSTDISGEVLDAYAAAHSNVRVIHQKNSGWPGKPRNVGIAASQAPYIFFCDADDLLGPEALRRMVDYALANDVDLLVPRMVGLGGRGVQAALFRETYLDVDLRKILGTLSPQKMFRRSMLDQHDIRFPEGKVRLEDWADVGAMLSGLGADLPARGLRLLLPQDEGRRRKTSVRNGPVRRVAHAPLAR
ncbi:glycosyltransferase family 2 protein [Arthrobacter crystallopoietes]|uniref:glycosyltransferase family 2 protein n=1 Tax=Crystallibacter crystallopoietes TaxID=37928 RepID=UPI001113A414|nr:glycosyltransferase family 2 protein [Arthrobacter crystallopoietes]